jgi:hypothetical protein
MSLINILRPRFRLPTNLYRRLAVVVVSKMERLKSRPHVEPEQDKATSSLLSHRRTTITDRDSSFHDISISEPYRDEQRAFTGYDDDDVHALHGIARENEQNRTVLWKGLPHYLLTWELLGISLSLCFLGTCACSRCTY